ncbi:MAG: DNA polymerase III subunit delta [Phycisphaerales bacterium]|nr:DNA polymerase III subunit delta [Phycisphaerales bacterium]
MVILHGKDSFLMTRYSRDFEEVLEKEYGEIDRINFDGDSVDLATVLDELRTYDLLMRHKLVIVDHADTFLASKDSDSTSTRKALERYAQSPVDSATLLLRASSWRKGNLDKIVNKSGVVFKLQELNEHDSVRWCIGRCGKEHGCELDSKAAQLLVKRIGTTLTRLDGELGKLSAKVAPETSITYEVVAEMVGLSREEQAWEIQSVLLSGHSGAVITKIGELIDISRQPRELLVWSVVDLSRRLAAASAMHASGSSAGDIRRSLKLFGSVGDRVIAVAKRRSPNELANLFTDSVAMDAKMRSGKLDSRRGVELLALQVCKAVV